MKSAAVAEAAASPQPPPAKRQVSGGGVSAGFGSEWEIAVNENYCKRQLKKVYRLAKSS